MPHKRAVGWLVAGAVLLVLSVIIFVGALTLKNNASNGKPQSAQKKDAGSKKEVFLEQDIFAEIDGNWTVIGGITVSAKNIKFFSSKAIDAIQICIFGLTDPPQKNVNLKLCAILWGRAEENTNTRPEGSFAREVVIPNLFYPVDGYQVHVHYINGFSDWIGTKELYGFDLHKGRIRTAVKVDGRWKWKK